MDFKNDNNFESLHAVFVNCTLKKSPQQSHTQGLMDMSMHIMKKEGVHVDTIRLVDHDHVATGVYPDMTLEGWSHDEWPAL